MDTLQLALQQIKMLEENGLDVHDLVRALDDADFASGPTLSEIIERLQPRLSHSTTMRTYYTHWRRFAAGFVIRACDYDLCVDVAEELGVPMPETFDDDQVVTDWYADAKRRTMPMVVIAAGDPDLRLRAVTLRDVETWAGWTRVLAVTDARVRNAVRRREGRPPIARTQDGATAVAQMCSALNHLFKVAIGDRLMPEGVVSPTTHFRRPKRSPQPKPLMSPEQVLEVWHVVNTDDYDPELYSLLTEFHLHAAARQEGAINLDLKDLDFSRQLVRLTEKGGGQEVVPSSLDLMQRLEAFAHARGSESPDDPVFRRKRRVADAEGQLTHPRIARSTYTRLHRIVQDRVGWAAGVGFGSHWLRGHSASMVAEVSRPEVKRAFLRHQPVDASDRYGAASLEEVAAAHGAAFGYQHPLAR